MNLISYIYLWLFLLYSKTNNYYNILLLLKACFFMFL